MDNEIIVVGAGISGLLATLALSKEGKKVLILEKTENLGGVCRSYDVDGYKVDTGPHVITRLEHGPLKELMSRYFDVIPNFVPHGRYYVRLNNRIKPFPWNLQGWFNFDLIPQIDRIYLMKTLFTISYIFNSGEDLSRKSVGDLVGSNITESTKRFLNCISYFMTGTSMDETPVARFLDSEHYKTTSAGFLEKLYSILMKEGAVDQAYPKGGLQSLTTSVISSFPRNRVDIRTGGEVLKINTDSEITVETTNNEYKCKTMIYSGFASDLPKIMELPKDYAKSLKKLHKTNALTIWLGLNKKIFTRDGSEIWADSNPYTWAVPVSNYDNSLAPDGKQLVGFLFRLPDNCNIETEKKRALNAIFSIIPEIERHIEMTHYQVLIPEKAAWTIDTKFADIRTPVKGIYLAGTDTEMRSMGITRASYSVLKLLSALREDKILNS